MTITKRLYTALIVAALLFGCAESKPPAQQRPITGEWQIHFHVGEVDIPVRLTVSDTVWTIHNAAENIHLDSIEWRGNMFRVKMPLFNTILEGELLNQNEIKGLWTDHSRDSLYQIPFDMKSGNLYGNKIKDEIPIERVYDCTFSKQIAKDAYKAIGLIREDEEGYLMGTFLTETGDYRYLQGNTTGQSIHLSSFDGAHLFHFCANVLGDSLTDGKFYSGKHWSEPWEAATNPSAKLRDPDSLTFITNASSSFHFKVRASSGDSIDFDTDDFKDNVSVVQIFGSWCPNCTDESIFLKQLHSKYASRGFRVIPVAFERGDDFDQARKHVQEQFGELGLPYEAYFGGPANKGCASQVFSGLSKILSYPTTIFIDKQGKVRKVHTGFYGPGTGDYYLRHTEMLDMFVAQLLSE